jgi:hypothetical protein
MQTFSEHKKLGFLMQTFSEHKKLGFLMQTFSEHKKLGFNEHEKLGFLMQTFDGQVGKLLTLIMLILPTYLLTYLSSLVF